MLIDCHVHVCAFTPSHGKTSPYLLNTLPFRFMRWRLGLPGSDAATERALEGKLIGLMDQTPELDAAVVLAFDGVYDEQGRFDEANTHLFVTNDYAAELAGRYPGRVLMGASVHPYRPDAVKELERAISLGAVLLKWLPIVQGFDPSDARCVPVYEALAHHRLPLLAHTGGEKSLPNVRKDVADPRLLTEALRRGVTVIAAHCGTRSAPGETDFVPEWARMALEHENFYGDSSALNLPTRAYAWKTLLGGERLMAKVVHGSDWPILPLPHWRVGVGEMWRLMWDRNWIRRDIGIKRALGVPEAHFTRAASLLRMPQP